MASLEDLLQQLQTPNNEVIKRAEEQLRVVLKRPDSVLLLMTTVGNSLVEFVRHLGAILLRHRLRGHWEKRLSDSDRSAVKQGILQLLGAEPARLVRKSLASAVAEVARLALEPKESQWPELFQVISSCASAASPEQREIAYVLLLELAPVVGEALLPHHATLREMFSSALADADDRVRTAAMGGVSALLAYVAKSVALEDEDPSTSVAMQFVELVPALLQVASQCLVEGNEDVVCDVLDVFSDLVATPLPLINDQLGVLMPFLLEVMRADHAFEIETRDSAAYVLNALADWKPKLLGRGGFVPKILEVIAWLIATSEGSVAGNIFEQPISGRQGNFEKDADDDDRPTSQGMAQSLLDMIALKVPQTYVLEPTMAIVLQCLGNDDPSPAGAAQRKAGVCILAVVCQGCQEYLRTQISLLLPLVLRAVQDNSLEVKEGACFCLGQMAEHLSPEIFLFDNEILPSAIATVEGSNQNLQCVACYLIENFCENLKPAKIQPYLERLMTRLLQLLQVGRPDVQEKTLSAIAALAIASEEAFTPYLEAVANILLKLLEVTDEAFMRLRGGALETLGQISIAVGADTFRPYLEPCMMACSVNLSIGDSELTEYTFCFMANLIKAFGPQFNHFVPQLIPSLCGAIRDANTASFDFESVQDQYAHLVEYDDDDEEEDPILDGKVLFSVHTSVVDMQKAGLAALCAAVGFTNGACEPYTADILDTLAKCFGCWTSNIRGAAADCLCPLVQCSMAKYPPLRDWQPAEHASGDIAIQEHTQGVVTVAVDLCLHALDSDSERESVAAVVSALKDVCEFVGPYALCLDGDQGYYEINNKLMTHILKLLRGTAPCQTLVDEDLAAEGGFDDADHDSVLMDAVCDLVGMCAKCLGPYLIPYLDVMLPQVVIFAKPNRPTSDRAMAMGCIAEVLQNLGGEGCKKFGEEMLEIIRQGLKDPAHQVKNNAAFAIGALAEGLANAQVGPGLGGLSSQYPELLGELRPLLTDPEARESHPGMVDNAASALCRMIAAAPDALPVGQVFDQLLYPALPIRVDQVEMMPTYGTICNLILGQHRDMMNAERLSRALSILVATLRDEAATPEEVKMSVAQSISQMYASLGDLAVQAAGHLPADVQNALASVLSTMQESLSR